MSSDPSRLVPSPSVLTLGGVDYRLQPFRFRDLAELHKWVKELYPDPRIVAREFMAGQPPEVANHIFDRASEEAKSWPPAMDGPEMNASIGTVEGQARLVYIAVRRTVAGFTLEQAADLADSMTEDDMAKFIEIVLPGPGAESDPKARAEATTAGSTGNTPS